MLFLRRGGGLGGDLFWIDDAAAHLLDQRLQHAGGGLATRGAEVKPWFGLLEDGARVVGAIVTALSAILLRHGGHQPVADRPGRGERHALLDRHRGVFPRR